MVLALSCSGDHFIPTSMYVVAASVKGGGGLSLLENEKAPQAKDLEGQAEPVGLAPISPLGRRFSRPNGGVPLSTSKALYVAFTTIFPRRFSGEVPLRPPKAR